MNLLILVAVFCVGLVVILGWVWAGVVIGAVCVAAFVVYLHGELKARPLRDALRSMPHQDHFALMGLVDAHTPQSSNCCLAIDVGDFPLEDRDFVTGSKIGGIGYVEDADIDDLLARSWRFRFQLRIPEWVSPVPRRGDLLVFFAQSRKGPWIGESELVALRYQAPESVNRSLRAGSVAHWDMERALWKIHVPRVPYGERRHRNVFSPRLLLKTIPGLEERLVKLCSNPEVLLAGMFTPTVWIGRDDDFDVIDRIQIGGAPHWIQAPEIVTCSHCERPMTFLCSIGNGASKELLKGEGEVVYVFGCVEHLDEISCLSQFD